jgi:hypothetical protein
VTSLLEEINLLKFKYFCAVDKAEDGGTKLDEWLTKNNHTYEYFEKLNDSEKSLLLDKISQSSLNNLKTLLEQYSIYLGINDMKEVILDDGYGQGFVFMADASLAGSDHIFKAMTESGEHISVCEFTTKCAQLYADGEYDEGQLSGNDMGEYYESVKECLNKARAFPKNDLNIEAIPVWRILGDSLLRSENGHRAYEGIEVVFCYFAADEDGNENADNNYKVYNIHVDSLEDEKTLDFDGGLENCMDLAKVDWPYMQEKYDEKKATESEDLTDDFENTVRQNFSEFIESQNE